MFVWLIVSLFVGMMASGTRIGFAGGFIISLILSPIVGIIAVLASGPKN